MAVPYGLPAALSLLAGGGLALLNLTVLKRSVRLFTGGIPAGGAPLAALLATLRLTGVLALAGWMLIRTPVEPLAFGIGLVLSVPAVAWHGLAEARRGTSDGSPPEHL